ncbi:MAG: rhodanese-like domain-containing protein [Verrucomicrobiales bacterium]|nr:rhodanese-like domain-containing protein [Verrucomicrobiales bacterium]
MKLSTLTTALCLLLGTLPACARDSAVHVNAEQAAQKIQTDDVIIIDVRTQEEFEEGHIEGARLIDFLEKDFADQVAKLDPQRTYLIHCQSGGRSSNALPIFEKQGIKHLIHLDGGFLAWKKAGLPVQK